MFRPFLFLPLVLAPAMAPLLGSDDAATEPRMVDLNVVALDSHGAPVTDLTRDDFRVTDNGKPQAIAFFRHRDSAAELIPQLAPGEFSNRTAANVPRATLILFDLLNEKFGTRGTTANNLIQDLQALESPDYVYLYILTVNGQLFPVHGLPGAEGETRPPNGGPWTHNAKAMIDQALKDTLSVRDPLIVQDVEYRARLTFAALDALAGQLASVPGRKCIVWLSDGVPIALGPRRSDSGDFVDFTPLLRQMGEAMDRSAVSIYSVRTIMLGSPDNIDGAGYDGEASLQTLDTFAQLTGGRPDAGKDAGAAVRQALIDMRTSYQIGFYPPPNAWDDKFHKLRIVCSRKNVRIQAKNGYYAWREPPGTHSNDAMLAALSTRFDAAEIGLRARLAPDSKTHTLAVEAHVDAHDVVLVHQGDAYNGQLRVALAGLAVGARPRSSPPVPLNLHFSAQERDRALQEGIGFQQDVNVSDDIGAVRVIVYDRNSEAIGSVTIPISAAMRAKPN